MKLKRGVKTKYLKYVRMNSKDGYSKAVVTYAEDWAAIMEKKLKKRGVKVKDIAEASGHEADTQGITGFMYGCAVSALAQFWVHGEELRRWHNREYLDEEKAAKADKSGGVVNPAILTFG